MISTHTLAHDHAPAEGSTHHVHNAKISLFKKMPQNLKLKLSFDIGESYTHTNYREIELGLFKRLPKKQQIGVSLVENQGLRHTDDWILVSSNNWYWKDTSQREEISTRFYYSKKFRPNQMTPLLFEYKNYLQYNFFNEQITFVPKLSSHYFFFQNGKPQYSIRVEAPLYIPVNYEEIFIYKSGLYTSFIYHYSNKLSLALTYKRMNEHWSESEESKEIRPNESYTVEEQVEQFGLNIVFNI